MGALVEAINAPVRAQAPAPSSARRVQGQSRRSLTLAGAAVLIVAVVAAAIWLWRSAHQPDEPRIAIASADGSPLSRQVARDLALRVPNLSSGDDPAYELVDASRSPLPQADLILTADAISSSGREHRDLALRAPNDEILWSASIDQPAGGPADLSQQLAIEAQRAISCAAEALSYRRERIRQNTLKLYLSGCTNFDNAYGADVDNSEQVKLFERIIARSPHFEPAWAKLLILEVDSLGKADDPATVRRTIATQVAQAQKSGLDFGELYAAKAAALSPADFLGIFRTYQEGLKRHPGSAILYRTRGERYLYVGRMSDSIEDSARAVELDPLSPANLQSLASSYAYAGNTEAAYAQLRKAERLWPRAPTIIHARYRLDLRYGDAKEALALLQEPTEQGPLQSEQAAFLRARIDPSPANIERSIAEDRKVYLQYPDFIAQIVQTLGQFGRKEEVLDILLHYSGGEQSGLAAEVLFRPALRDVWRDPRSIAAAAHLGLLRYWKASGKWPDFCSDPTLPYDCRKEAAKYRV